MYFLDKLVSLVSTLLTQWAIILNECIIKACKFVAIV